jgi:hypothetical protein
VNGERRRARIPRRISWIAASLSGLTLGSVVVVAAIPHPPGAVPPLYAAGIAEKPCAPHDVIIVPAGSREHYFASSSVL